MVTPGTLLRWHWRLVRWRCPYPPRGGRRRRAEAKLVALIERIARENPGWGRRHRHGPGD
jgi:putative transposase